MALLRQQTATGRPSDLRRRAVREAKTRGWEEFGEAMEKDFQSAPKKFLQTVQRLRTGKQNPIHMVFSMGGELLASNESMVWW